MSEFETHPDPRLDARLDALWDATEAPADHFAFALAVEDRVARRAMLIDLAWRVVAAAALAVLAIAFEPMLVANAAAMVGSLDAAGPALAAAAVIVAVVLWLNRPPAEA